MLMLSLKDQSLMLPMDTNTVKEAQQKDKVPSVVYAQVCKNTAPPRGTNFPFDVISKYGPNLSFTNQSFVARYSPLLILAATARRFMNNPRAGKLDFCWTGPWDEGELYYITQAVHVNQVWPLHINNSRIEVRCFTDGWSPPLVSL